MRYVNISVHCEVITATKLTRPSPHTAASCVCVCANTEDQSVPHTATCRTRGLQSLPILVTKTLRPFTRAPQVAAATVPSAFVNSTSECDHTVFAFLCLPYFAQHSGLHVHPRCRVAGLPSF